MLDKKGILRNVITDTLCLRILVLLNANQEIGQPLLSPFIYYKIVEKMT